MERKIGRLIERYLIGDIVDIILEYNKKCLWEYKNEFPSKEDANGFDCFDDYLINRKPGNKKKSPNVLDTIIPIQPVTDTPIPNQYTLHTSPDGVNWSQQTNGNMLTNTYGGQFVAVSNNTGNGNSWNSIAWIAARSETNSEIEEPPDIETHSRSFQCPETTRQTLIPGVFKWERNFNSNDDDEDDNNNEDDKDNDNDDEDNEDNDTDEDDNDDVNKTGKTDMLFLGFSCENDLWIPVSRDEHTKVYNYLKQYFNYL